MIIENKLPTIIFIFFIKKCLLLLQNHNFQYADYSAKKLSIYRKQNRFFRIKIFYFDSKIFILNYNTIYVEKNVSLVIDIIKNILNQK